MATSIFSVIEGLTVTKEDIVEAELFAERYLSAQFPTYDFRQGTALRDMTVRPNATLIALVNKAITHYFDSSDLANITNDTPNEIADKKFSNFFVTRKSGNNAVISARLYFLFPLNRPIDSLIPANAYFSPDNEILYYPQGNITVYAQETAGEYFFSYDSAMDMHYVDIPLEASNSDSKASLEEGDLLYFTVFSPYFLQASIQSLQSIAVSEETNEEMVERAYTSVSTRNLINTPSIVARIGDMFNYIKETVPVGLGHPWLYRDIVNFEDSSSPGVVHSYHRGGHVDVYLSTSPTLETVQLEAVADNDMPGRNVFYVTGSIFEVFRSTTSPVGKQDDTVPVYVSGSQDLLSFTYEAVNVSEYDASSIPLTPLSDLGLSAKQLTKIIVNNGVGIDVGDTATFTFSSFQGISSVNTTINSKSESVVCADYLARSFEPVFLDINVELRNQQIPEDEKIPFDNLNEYVESISSGGSIFMSEVVNRLIDSGVVNFKMPLDIKAVRYHRDIGGNENSSTATTTTSITDTMDLNTIQKFYLRSINYIEV